MATPTTQHTDLLKPSFDANNTPEESPQLKALIKALGLTPHPEGGYFVV
jgi:hypothetical protein